MKRVVSLVAAALIALVACSDDPAEEPSPIAPPSRHAALRDSLASDAKAFTFTDGDWQEDLGDAPFFGPAWLTHRVPLEDDDRLRRDQAIARAKILLGGELLEGDLQDKVMAALGLIEHIAVTNDRAELPTLDDFVDRLDSLTRTLGNYLEAGADRSWAIRTYGPTAVTALVALLEAQYVLFVGGDRKAERLERAQAIDAKIGVRAFGDLASGAGTSRGYAIAPGRAELELYPNVSMLMLKARLFRITKDEAYRLEARALYAAIQPLKLSDVPARYASPYASTLVGAKTNDVSTLSSQNYLALSLLLLFEITGEQRFVDEADRVFDSIEKMRGPYCIGEAAEARCANGLLHHFVDGRLAEPGDGTLFCSGCNLQTLYVLGYRRSLANEPW
jgi:hypothetical protein